jgi:hypothetical protein
MRKASLVLLLGIALFLVSNPVYAQKKTPSFGIGVSMGREVIFIYYQSMFTMSDYPSFYMPIRISPGFRIEPEFGLWRYSYSRDGGDRKSTYTVLSLGCGIFPMTNKGKVNIYYGGRLGFLSISESYKNKWDGHIETDDDSKTDFYIGPVIGGEYLFTDHLSLGGEVQLNYTSYGRYNEDVDVSESLISTKTLIFVRWYF